MAETVKKIDDNTIEVTTRFDKADLLAQKAEIEETIAESKAQVDRDMKEGLDLINERLAVFN